MSLDVITTLGSVYNTGTRSYQNVICVGGVKNAVFGSVFIYGHGYPMRPVMCVLKVKTKRQLDEVGTAHTPTTNRFADP
ncbi:hypothetical protein P7H15_23050 [Paenibacillus larvae]|nr:hypothetical protein [Paenibacillus larvae]MDT2295109.1 hypothetical protein [Paenibacillus larvae]